MTDIRDRLRDADPVAIEPAPSHDDIAAIKRTVLEAVQTPRATPVRWRRTLAIAATVALIGGAGIDTLRRTSRSPELPAPEAVPVAAAPVGKTQLHFSTPGGTRIIWTLDPAFQLTEKR
jgi:hypothetical protein